MKNIFIVLIVLFFAGFSHGACGDVENDVLVRITHAYLSDLGTKFCFAINTNTNKRYEVIDCGYLNVGDQIKGKVYTHWLGELNVNGEKVCDYQTFIPNNNQR